MGRKQRSPSRKRRSTPVRRRTAHTAFRVGGFVGGPGRNRIAACKQQTAPSSAEILIPEPVSPP